MHFCDLLGMLLFKHDRLNYSVLNLGQYYMHFLHLVMVISNLENVPLALLTQSMHTKLDSLIVTLSTMMWLNDLFASTVTGVQIPSNIPHQLHVAVILSWLV